MLITRAAAPVLACEPPEGFVTQDGDCDDGDAAFFPGATETDCADPNDYNCDGSVGFEDNDADGFPACLECDDGARAVNPLAVEVCDEIDNDCDGQIDADAIDTTRYHQDVDGDGFGDPDFFTDTCAAPEGYTEDDNDCDDSRAAVTTTPTASPRPGQSTTFAPVPRFDADASLIRTNSSIPATYTKLGFAEPNPTNRPVGRGRRHVAVTTL